MSEDTLLKLIFRTKEEMHVKKNVKTGGSFDCSDREKVEFRTREKNQKMGSQALTSEEQTSACSAIWLEETSGRPWTARGQGELFNGQELPPPNSGMIHLHVQEIKRRQQQACMAEQVT